MSIIPVMRAVRANDIRLKKMKIKKRLLAANPSEVYVPFF
jgi:hypothetical protein